jgi:hypothetical protein
VRLVGGGVVHGYSPLYMIVKSNLSANNFVSKNYFDILMAVDSPIGCVHFGVIGGQRTGMQFLESLQVNGAPHICNCRA